MDKPLSLSSPETAPIPEVSPQPPVPEVEPKREAEKTPETLTEQPEKAETARLPGGSAVVPSSDVSSAVASRDPLLIEVENELEAGLWDAYREMPPALRLRFKAEGERVAQAVREGFATGRITAQRIIEMITEWLKMIPKVNKWFLRQEAKIKADALMRIQRNRQGNGDDVIK
jgi:hypothetical protein